MRIDNLDPVANRRHEAGEGTDIEQGIHGENFAIPCPYGEASARVINAKAVEVKREGEMGGFDRVAMECDPANTRRIMTDFRAINDAAFGIVVANIVRIVAADRPQ